MSSTISGSVHYFGDAPGKPTFHAKDHGRDNWRPDVREVTFHDARRRADPPSLTREGVTIAPHRTAVTDFTDREQIREVYARELADLLRALTGARRVVGLGLANMRFSPRHPRYKDGANSQPAHFPHIDVTPRTSHGLEHRRPRLHRLRRLRARALRRAGERVRVAVRAVQPGAALVLLLRPDAG